MAIIRIPAPAPQSFRKDRPISDLVKSQIRHFQHLEHKLQLNLPIKFSPQQLTTEAAAAQYIAEMTTALRGSAVEVPAPSRRKPDTTPAARPRPKTAQHPRETSPAVAAAPKVRKAKKRAPKKHPRKKS